MLIIFVVVIFIAWCLVDDSRSFTFKSFIALAAFGAYYYLNSPYSAQFRMNYDAWVKSFNPH